MDKKRKIALVGATLAVALGSGYLMQTQGPARVAAATVVPDSIVPLAATTDVSSDTAAAAMPPEPVAEVPAPLAADVPAVSASDIDPAAVPASELPEPVATVTACPVSFEAMAVEGAQIDLTLLAPCAASQRVVLRHGGLTFTAQTTATGGLFLNLPAMEPTGHVSIRFENGNTAETAAAVDLSSTRRFAMQWVADDAFQVQAYENGATFDGPGHVSAKVPHLPVPGEPAKSGYMTQLGDASVHLPMLAEVYTYPPHPGTRVDVTVEATVTEATCNREILGEAVESRYGEVATSDVTLAMPDCSAMGDFLVLNNLVPETKLATAD